MKENKKERRRKIYKVFVSLWEYDMSICIFIRMLGMGGGPFEHWEAINWRFPGMVL